MFRSVTFLVTSLLFSNVVHSNENIDNLGMLIDQVFSQNSWKPPIKEYHNSKLNKTDEAPNKIIIPRYIDQTCTTLRDGPGLCMNYHDCLYGQLVPNNSLSLQRKESDDPCTGIVNACCPVDAVPEGKKYLLNLKTPNCGISNSIIDSTSQPSSLNMSAFGEFPWMVAVLRILPNVTNRHRAIVREIYHCGGSLIHPRVVMTGALCGSTLTLNDTIIRVGEWDTQAKTERFPHQDMSLEKVIIHDQFYKGNMQYSIALLILESEVYLAANVDVVCLPPINKTPYGRCLMSGWGKDKFEDGRYQTTLKKLEMPFINNVDCNEALRKTRLGPNFQLHSSFICAGGEKDVDACKGDEGSPLVCKLLDAGHRHFQYGIVSWGIGCGQPGVPGVYTDVASLRQWIDQKLLDNQINMDDYTF